MSKLIEHNCSSNGKCGENCLYKSERVAFFNESMLSFLRYSSNLGRERLLTSSNILMVVISFCFMAEATLFASENLRIAFMGSYLFFLFAELVILANMQLLLSLWLAVKAPSKMVAVCPVVTDCITGNKKEGLICENLIVNQFSMAYAMIDCVNIAREHVSVAQNAVLIAIVDFLICMLAAMFGHMLVIDQCIESILS